MHPSSNKKFPHAPSSKSTKKAPGLHIYIYFKNKLPAFLHQVSVDIHASDTSILLPLRTHLYHVPHYPTRYHFSIYATVKIHQPLISLCIPEGPMYAEGLYCTTTSLLINHLPNILVIFLLVFRFPENISE